MSTLFSPFRHESLLVKGRDLNLLYSIVPLQKPRQTCVAGMRGHLNRGIFIAVCKCLGYLVAFLHLAESHALLLFPNKRYVILCKNK